MSTSVTSTTNSTSTSLAGSLTGSSGSSRVAGGQMGKMEFLKLLTAQLAHQDPLDPMDGKEMASDLAQFSGLEQLLNINKALESQASQNSQLLLASQNSMAMNAVGKTAVIDSDKVIVSTDAATGLKTGTVMADIATSGNARLTLLNASGKEVGSVSLGYLAAGSRQTFDVGQAASGVKDGAYAFRIDVTDGTSGKDVPQKTYTVGKIDGLTYGTDGAAQLTMGPLTIAYDAIVKLLA